MSALFGGDYDGDPPPEPWWLRVVVLAALVAIALGMVVAVWLCACGSLGWLPGQAAPR